MLINKVKFDHLGNLWVATQNNGVYLKTGTARHWIHFTRSHIGGYTLGKAVGLYEDRNGNMWIMTLGNGLFSYTPAPGRYGKCRWKAMERPSRWCSTS